MSFIDWCGEHAAVVTAATDMVAAALARDCGATVDRYEKLLRDMAALMFVSYGDDDQS